MQFQSLNNEQGKHIDVVIVSVPWCDTNFALMAPAALKPVVEKTGKSCLAVDLNAEVVPVIKQSPMES